MFRFISLSSTPAANLRSIGVNNTTKIFRPLRTRRLFSSSSDYYHFFFFLFIIYFNIIPLPSPWHQHHQHHLNSVRLDSTHAMKFSSGVESHHLWEPLISPRAKELLAVLRQFVNDECVPAARIYEAQLEENTKRGRRWDCPRVMEELKVKAKALGLFNMFLPKEYPEGAGLTNLEYALMAETMGRCHITSEACNCSAPDTGNMEVLAKYGNAAQKDRWLKPLMEGKIRSVFLMTEPRVASSDASNIETRVTREGDSLVINGRKWWSSGASDTRCKVGILMCKIDGYQSKPRHQQQSMVLVPMDAPGITIMRHLTVFGYDDAPHGHAEVDFKNVRVPISSIILGEGRGFEISQGRLGPGRIHHCMRTIGCAERAIEAMVDRVKKRSTFGRKNYLHGTIIKDIADSRMEIDQGRLLVLAAAHEVDVRGGKLSRKAVTMIKVAVPNMCLRVLDRAIQAHGGAGVCQDFFLARAYANMRTLRIADGPDEVHRMVTARMEISRGKPLFPGQHIHDPEVYHNDENMGRLTVDYSDPGESTRVARL